MEVWMGIRAEGQYEAGMFLIEGLKTAEEFISLAWMLEDATRVFYDKALGVLADEEAKKIFSSLVSAEEIHKEKLLNALKKLTGSTVHEVLSMKPVSGFMESGVEVESAVSWLRAEGRSLHEVLEFSMQLEINSLDLYYKISRDLPDAAAGKTFEVLIAEEKEHLARLGNLLNVRYNV